jgi:8-amino-7-oxononanoate synthase
MIAPSQTTDWTYGAFEASAAESPALLDLEVTSETSLADIFEARRSGVDVRTIARFFHAGLGRFEAAGHSLYRRTLLRATDAEVPIHYPRESTARHMINLASNNYLGLASHPRVIAAAQEAVARFGTSAGSSPLLVGTFPVTHQLETKLAELKGAQDACVFSTGYQANLGVISAVVSKGDLVVLDRLAHASMVDGARMSGAETKVFRHNDAGHLDRVLSRHRAGGTKLVCVEGIYSMDGDVAPLHDIWAVTRRHDALLLVDEAHSTGVLGVHGRGVAEQFGLEGKIDFHLGTLSKALASCGGFVAGNRDLITYVRYFARPGMFSTALPPTVLAAASAAIDVMMDEPQRRAQLWRNCRYMHGQLRRLGFQINERPSPIIPVVVGTMRGLREMTLELHQQNICVNSVPFPAVARGSERLRISLTANHTLEQLGRAVECIRRAADKVGIVRGDST